jgi:hypothetical protein
MPKEINKNNDWKYKNGFRNEAVFLWVEKKVEKVEKV